MNAKANILLYWQIKSWNCLCLWNYLCSIVYACTNYVLIYFIFCKRNDPIRLWTLFVCYMLSKQQTKFTTLTVTSLPSQFENFILTSSTNSHLLWLGMIFSMIGYWPKRNIYIKPRVFIRITYLKWLSHGIIHRLYGTRLRRRWSVLDAEQSFFSLPFWTLECKTQGTDLST